MGGVQVESFDFKRKACVRQMIRVPVVGGSGTPANSFNIDLCLQRIIMSKQPIPNVFSFELSEYPPALFSQGMMREWESKIWLEDVSTSNVLWGSDVSSTDDIIIVPDGGRLIHFLIKSWKTELKYDTIADQYLIGETRKTSHPILNVWDGYLTMRTKDHTQVWRNAVSSLQISLNGSETLDDTPENFLSNSKNKQAFIDFLCAKIRTSAPSGRLANVQCTADADRSIVATALDLLH